MAAAAAAGAANGPPEPNNNQENVEEYAQQHPHEYVKAGSIWESQFSRDLKIDPVLNEYFEDNADDWHTIERDLAPGQIHQLFERRESGMLNMYPDVFQCMSHYGIEGSEPEEDGTLTDERGNIKLPKRANHPLYTTYPWLSPIYEDAGLLYVFGFVYDITYSPHEDVYQTSKVYIAFVQSGPYDVKVYITWHEKHSDDEYDFGVWDHDIIDQIEHIERTIEHCSRPHVRGPANTAEIRRLAERRGRATLVRQLQEGQPRANGSVARLPQDVARTIAQMAPLNWLPNARRRKTRRNRKTSRKNRRHG